MDKSHYKNVSEKSERSLCGICLQMPLWVNILLSNDIHTCFSFALRIQIISGELYVRVCKYCMTSSMQYPYLYVFHKRGFKEELNRENGRGKAGRKKTRGWT